MTRYIIIDGIKYHLLQLPFTADELLKVYNSKNGYFRSYFLECLVAQLSSNDATYLEALLKRKANDRPDKLDKPAQEALLGGATKP